MLNLASFHKTTNSVSAIFYVVEKYIEVGIYKKHIPDIFTIET
jgi:hypothetical protein